MFSHTQFRDVVRRNLTILGKHSDIPYSLQAENLLLMTALAESDFGTFLRQCGGGPALGVFQLEPATIKWLTTLVVEGRFGSSVPALIARHYNGYNSFVEDLALQIFYVRLRYRVAPAPLPRNPEEAADYWKRYYNTAQGKGSAGKVLKLWENLTNETAQTSWE